MLFAPSFVLGNVVLGTTYLGGPRFGLWQIGCPVGLLAIPLWATLVCKYKAMSWLCSISATLVVVILMAFGS
jgi:hypothetical protein